MRQSRLHFFLTLLWVALVIPTLLWWRESILWITLISIYANIVGHWGSYEAARAKELSENERESSKDD